MAWGANEQQCADNEESDAGMCQVAEESIDVHGFRLTVELSCGPATRTKQRHCTGLMEPAAQRQKLRIS